MDRIVFIVVALALLVATQAQADDPWFNSHCEESREIMASVRPGDTAPSLATEPTRAAARADKPALRRAGEAGTGVAKPHTRSSKPKTRL
jgi:hypothetical protein